jgi:hypothetical protein
MAEPQPSTVREGADIEDEAPVAPKSAEDRKAAAALSTLSAHDDESSAPKPEVDTKALGDAMSRLDMTGKAKGDDEKKKKEEEGVVKKKVKVDQGDVALLVSACCVYGTLCYGDKNPGGELGCTG